MPNDEKPFAPCWMYRLGENNQVEAKLFNEPWPENEDWQDSPPKPKGRPPAEPKPHKVVNNGNGNGNGAATGK